MVKEDKLKDIVASVLGIDASSINDTTSPDTVNTWDSLKHLKLVLAIEGEFDISLSEEQVIEMMNYPLIKEILKEHNVGF